MCSSFSPFSLLLPCKTRLLCIHRFNFPILHYSNRFLTNIITPRNPSRSCVDSSITENNLELSWFSPDRENTQDNNGWAIVETPSKKKHKGLPTFVLLGIGTSIVGLLAALAHFSLSRKGFVFRISSPFHVDVESKTVGSDVSSGDGIVSEATPESVAHVVDETLRAEASSMKREEVKPGQVIVPFSVDSTQQEALMLLKNLKIFEDDVKAEELCTRREYARWLVLANSLLERNPKHRIVPSIALSASTIAAFDDVSVKDPDFGNIQSLAEAGIVLSKLSGENSISDLDDSKSLEGVNFFPERFISRQDLMGWKAKLEYKVMLGINEEISRNNIGFMDAREIRSDVLVELFIDLLADNKSIMRKVFGQGKRFQPDKPCTKAQAAVALTSGRMTKAIFDELSKLEAENSSRLCAMEEIRYELLEKGDIQRRWVRILQEEKKRGLEVERAYFEALKDFEQEKIVQEIGLAAYLKEKAALDCQKQLLSSLKEEVDDMSQRLTHERAKHMNEQHNIHSMLSELEVKHEGVLDAKSILEAEVEALRILRSWIEDEARKGQARAKVLEEVGRRWKWENRS